MATGDDYAERKCFAAENFLCPTMLLCFYVSFVVSMEINGNIALFILWMTNKMSD